MITSEHVVIPKAKALLWDFDDTMLESRGEVEQITGVMAMEFGCPPPDSNLVRANSYGPLPDTLIALLGKVSAAELERRVARFHELQQDRYNNPAERLFDDAVNLAARAAARGLAQIIVTNRMHRGNGKASPRAVVERTVLKDWIAQVICRDDMEYLKPDRRVVGTSLIDRGIDPKDTVVIGDQYVDAGLALELEAQAIIVCRDSDELVNAHLLPDGWRNRVTVVRSLRQVQFEPRSIPKQATGSRREHPFTDGRHSWLPNTPMFM